MKNMKVTASETHGKDRHEQKEKKRNSYLPRTFASICIQPMKNRHQRIKNSAKALVLHLIVECQKRVIQEDEDSRHEAKLLPVNFSRPAKVQLMSVHTFKPVLN